MGAGTPGGRQLWPHREKGVGGGIFGLMAAAGGLCKGGSAVTCGLPVLAF